MTCQERALPDGVQQKLRRHERLTTLIAGLVLYGPLLASSLASRPLPEVIVPAFVGTVAWGAYREWVFRRRLLCPRCSGRLQREEQPSERGQDLLRCPRCAIRWDTGRRRQEPNQNPG